MVTALMRFDPVRLIPGDGGQVLLLSMRRLARLVAYSMVYEFEDVISDVTGADRIEVRREAALERARRGYKLARIATRSRWLALRLAPRPDTIRLQRDYELFLPIFNHPHELYALQTVPDWRARCRKAACFINEVWVHTLPEYLLELLTRFDHIFTGTLHSAEGVARIVGRPCSYLPTAVDVLRFAPSQQTQRCIDVCNIGRRSETTHEALLALARTRKIFYYYDTIAGGAGKHHKQRTFQVEEHDQHRLLLAALLQRSRYYIVNRSRINQPEYTGDREEISGRFYEGAAAGVVLLGEAPRTKEFQRQFDWPDAVIPMPFDCADVNMRLAELDREPRRLARIYRNNVHHAALRHDWVYRLRTIFETVGMPATDSMQLRESSLRSIARSAGPFVDYIA